VTEAIQSAIATGREPSLDGALAGALAGAHRGAAALPPQFVSRLAQPDLLDQFAVRLSVRERAGATSGTRVRS
jgi:ADP-ribosylglycohydrolase